jgi:transcriptional regulator of aromatic amino acid metabolism
MPTFDMIGSSPLFRAVLEDVQVIASADGAVLVHGEIGSGTEMIAVAIHKASPRRQHRFVPINCAASPAASLESELFGRSSFSPNSCEQFKSRNSNISGFGLRTVESTTDNERSTKWRHQHVGPAKRL